VRGNTDPPAPACRIVLRRKTTWTVFLTQAPLSWRTCVVGRCVVGFTSLRTHRSCGTVFPSGRTGLVLPDRRIHIVGGFWSFFGRTRFFRWLWSPWKTPLGVSFDPSGLLVFMESRGLGFEPRDAAPPARKGRRSPGELGVCHLWSFWT
jgi:hypothetical protein